MNEVILLLLGIVGIFAITCSIALLALGKMIDRYPQDGEDIRERSLSSPKESTMIAVIVFWAMFIPGGWAVLQETRFALIVGITTIFAICLFMLTALVFSFAVLSTMKQREKTLKKEAMQKQDTPPMPPARQITPGSRTALASKLYKRPVTDLMFNAFLKKD